jgi:hypothetical protein
MFFFQGARDANTVTALVEEYAAEVSAPVKEIVLIPEAGHATVPFFIPEILALLDSRVRHFAEA